MWFESYLEIIIKYTPNGMKKKSVFLISTWHKTWDSLKLLAAVRLRSYSDAEVSA